ncbi:MAG: thermonuclease family protein [bacterium]
MKKAGFFAAWAVITASLAVIIYGAGLIIRHNIEKNKFISFETKVLKVIDGDTVKIKKGNRTVRLKGIDTPELHHPDTPVQAYAREAADYLKSRIENKTVRIEYHKDDVNDKYGRLLAYIYADDVMINAELVKKGYAFVYENTDCIRVKDFLVLEQVARKFRKGIWQFRQGGQVKE